MKITELLNEYTFPKIEYINPRAKHPSAPRLKRRAERFGSDIKLVGQGSFADTFANPKVSPHEVSKVSNPLVDMNEVDGYYFYIKALEKHEDNTNPYFPRFSKIRVYREPGKTHGEKTYEDKITYSAQQERLYPLKDLTKTEKYAINRRLFGAEVDDSMLENVGFHNIVRGQVFNTLKYDIVDSDFKRACAFIDELAQSQKLSIDIHDGNVMFRRTPYGPQLVITDPLAYQYA